MDRSAVFVDAGYLYAAGGKLLHNVTARKGVQLDALKAHQFLAGLAEAKSDLQRLRTYWYDGAKDRIPTAEQLKIAELANVKLRLGRINSHNQQKGVDALIYHDLMTLAREGAISDAFLLSGDEDLREGVKAAQQVGVRVTLIGVQAPDGMRNQSRDLVNEADEIVILGKEDLSSFISPRVQASETMVVDNDQTAKAELAATEYAQEWLDKATDQEVASLRSIYPRIPVSLDADLFVAVENEVGESLRGRDPLRKAIRKQFWLTIR
ncbi:MAG: NYN domain-containing protein [Acidimicrobiaceae bacterium]|nr:NYN domain-containing protein [Acidimicrobiaceae bacterium]